VNLRHTAALALLVLIAPSRALAGGWYLIEPPSKADVDTSCTGDPSILDRIRAVLDSKTASSLQFDRCLPEAEAISPAAPLSSWRQVQAYRTLKECQVELDFQRTAEDPLYRWEGQSLFFESHREDAKAYAEREFKMTESKEKEVDKEFKKELAQRDKWLSTLPKETRDRENAQPGTEGIYDEFEETFYLNHREEYPLFSIDAARAEFARERARSSRCVASDDPRLKEK
jgi:hypothetical protein